MLSQADKVFGVSCPPSHLTTPFSKSLVQPLQKNILLADNDLWPRQQLDCGSNTNEQQ